MATYWTVAEDNAGNLFLYAWSGKFKFVHIYDNLTQLREDINALENGSDIRTWDGNEGYAVWEELVSREYGSKIVAEGKFYRGKASSEYNFDAMGYAAHEAFGYSQEHYEYIAEDYEYLAPFTGTQAEIITNMAKELSKMRNTITNLNMKIQNLMESE